MKLITILSAIALIFIVESSIQGFTEKSCEQYQPNPQNYEDEEHSAFSKDFCRSLGRKNTTNKCCYVRYKVGEMNLYNCQELSLSQFLNIKDAISNFEAKYGSDVKEFVCDSSSYLYGSLLLLLVFLF